MSEIQERTLNSPGPISDAFLRDRSFISVIIGPVGSAKTMTALRKLVMVGSKQGGRRDAKGVLWRKAKVGVIRETYPNIEKNTLPSWFRIFAETDGHFTWKAPFTHKLRLILDEDAEGAPIDVCDFEIEFRAIGDRSVEEACRGWEVVAVMIDEADLQPPDLLAFLSGRVGRFSDLDPSLVVDQQIILSLNAPYMDNWVYGLAIEKNLGELEDPELIEALGGRPLLSTFIQPGGRAPGAENLHNLPRGYYKIQAAANRHRPDYVARMVDNKFVPMQHGQPVNPQFDYAAHARELDWSPRHKLIIGFDQGLYAAAVAGQRLTLGELRTLREAVSFRETGILSKLGPTAFGQMVKAMLAEHFPDVREDNIRLVGDPAAWAASDRADDELDWILAFRQAIGLKPHRAKTNKAALRNEAVWRAMGARDGYAIDSRHCPHLIKGHLGGYRYAKGDMKDGETRGHLEIADTVFTHVCDAEQYVAVEGEHVISDIRGRRRGPGARVVNDSGFDVFRGVA